MKKKTRESAAESTDNWEPPWLDPAYDRQTPYTEEELELFAEGFIFSMSDVEPLKAMVKTEGMKKVKEVVKERFRERDEKSLRNIRLTGSFH